MKPVTALIEELRAASYKNLIASFLHMRHHSMIRVRFIRTHDYQEKQLEVMKYILKTYTDVKDVTTLGPFMYIDL
jgi:hypothetical protein